MQSTALIPPGKVMFLVVLVYLSTEGGTYPTMSCSGSTV